MKRTVIALSLFAATATAVALHPGATRHGAVTPPVNGPSAIPIRQVDPTNNARPVIEVVFVLDTTGSMGGLLQAAKEKIWSIASTMAQADPAPEIRMGLVAYRDRGDDYVTRVVDLSGDLDTVYTELMALRASGGGDGPESVNQALHVAVDRINWSQDASAYKAVFLVGDAPPHMDYAGETQYPQSLAMATSNGIAVNTIQCGSLSSTTAAWRHIAQLGAGRYFQVDQAGSAVAIATPFDERLAELSARIDETRLYYGSVAERAAGEERLKAAATLHAGASDATRARRAAFHASKSGEMSFLGERELVEDAASGRVDLSTLEEDALPEALKPVPPAARQAALDSRLAERKSLKREIVELAEKRSAYLEERVDALGGAEGSLDDEIYTTVRDQATAQGMRYESASPRY